MKKRLIRLFSAVMVVAVVLSFFVIPSYAADKEYISSLKNAGFPSDYAKLLEKVHAKHPKWTFTPLVTGLNFDDAVAGESKAGVSTVDVTVSYFLMISRDRGSYNSDGTYTYKIVDGNQSKQTGHADASDLCISYFMDPRNFLTEDRTIFQFLDMSYPNNDTGIRVSVETAVNGTFLKKHVDALMKAGTTYDINPVYLVSKIFQEVGTSGENSAVNGKVSGYEGYYNCYNIGAYASSTGTAVINGLKYAKDKGWTSIDKSIIGGAEFIAKGYTSVGQHTPYLTKFNVNPKNKSYSIYTHQYMSAVYDPAQSARTIYNAYNEAAILDTAINFVIPVYKDMPTFSSTSVKLDDSTNSVVGKEPSLKNFYLRTEPNRNASYYTENGKAKAFANGTSVTILDRVRSNIVTDDDSSHNLYMFQLKLPFWYKVKVGNVVAYTAYENIPISATVKMKVGDKRTFGYSLTNDVTGAVRFEVLDSRIATVNVKTGEVVAKTTGTTQLIAYTASGSVDYINLTVGSANSTSGETTSSTTENSNRLFGSNSILRYCGDNRFLTSFATAEALKKAYNVSKFDNIIVADGTNFADALAGSYLATKIKAPIIMVNAKNGAKDNSGAIDYIAKNFSGKGKIYILGGTAAVSSATEKALIKDCGKKVSRLAGENRYETNIAILNEAGMNKEELLICDSSNFADALSASALGKPLLLINKSDVSLNSAQKDIIKKASKVYILGGTSAVPKGYESLVNGTVGKAPTRIAGNSRYETSVLIASTFCKNAATVVTATGVNFPDGLCGGSLAYALGAPLILTTEGQTANAKTFVSNNKAKLVVLGGTSALSDGTVKSIKSGNIKTVKY